jgi:signal peptidase I
MAAIVTMAAIGGWAVTTHRLGYVVTHGVSMEPLYHEGDLVFITKADSYEIGQIAAYHGGAGGRLEVLHRIIGGDPETGFIFKGDNKQSTDVERPTADQLIGRALLHIPHGGVVLRPVLSPTGLGMIGFLFASGAAAAKSRRDIPRGRRKKRVKGMSRQGGSWAIAVAVIKAVSRLHPILRMLAVLAAVCGIAGIPLAVLGWMKPITETVQIAAGEGESMTFGYSAEVGRSAAYDGTIVYSPAPVFRKVASFVDLDLAYHGEPGRIEVAAQLSAQSGWRSTVQLSQAKRFTTDRYTSKVRLDLNALANRGKEAGETIGITVEQVSLGITARILHDDGSTFEPQLTLMLSPLQLSLTSGAESLVVNKSGSVSGVSVQPRQIGAFGHDFFTAAQARGYAVRLILAAVVGAVIIAFTALRRIPLRNRAQIQRRYPHLLVPVEPMASPPGKPVVVVDTFPALVKLAEKYGQMILTWTRPDGADDFVVRDEGILYRYRIEPSVVPPVPAKLGRQPASASPTDGVASETGTLPVLQLPSVPASPPEAQADHPEEEEPEVSEDSPVKKAAPRKRTTRTAAAKAAAKTAPTKTTTAKRTPAKAPAKRTRAQATATTVLDSETTIATEVEIPSGTSPDQATPATLSAEAVRAPETSEPVVSAVTIGHPEDTAAAETTVDSVEPLVEQVPTTVSSDSVPPEKQPAGTPTDVEQEPTADAEAPLETESHHDPEADAGMPESDSAQHSSEPESRVTEPETFATEPGNVAAEAEPTEPETARAESTRAEPEGAQVESAQAGPESTQTESTPAETEGALAENAQAEVEGSQAEPAPDQAKSDTAQPEAPTAQGLAESETVEPQVPPAAESQPSRSQKRAGRRKARSRRAPQSGMDEVADSPAQTDGSAPVAAGTPADPEPEPEQSPADEAREDMEDLADRNRPITEPEPKSEANQSAEPQPEPKREPIYDFLPAAKRVPSPPEPDDELDA